MLKLRASTNDRKYLEKSVDALKRRLVRDSALHKQITSAS